MPIAENSSLRNTFSTSRLAIMLPAVERRSPAITTPRSQAAATIVVACGRFLITSLPPPGPPPGSGPAGSEFNPRKPGSRSGAYEARKSVNDGIRAAMNAPGCRAVPSKYPLTLPPPAEYELLEQTLPSVWNADAHARSRDVSPNANRPAASLAALLDVRTDEFLGVLLEHLIDLVEDRVHVVGQLLVPLLGLIDGRGLVFVGLLGAPRRLPLAPGVLRCHLRYLRPSRGAPPRQLQRYRRPVESHPILRRAMGPQLRGQPLLLRGERGDEVTGRAAAVKQLADVRPGTAQRLEGGDSRPGMSKITESQEAAATESAYCRRHRPRKYALVSSGGFSMAQVTSLSSVRRIIRSRATRRLYSPRSSRTSEYCRSKSCSLG